jgi:hypothetical protein
MTLSAPITPPAFTPDGRAFVMAIAGQEKQYSNDNPGKRQAILDGLGAIPPLAVDQESYLPSAPVLEIVAAVIYPEGVQTNRAYDNVRVAAEKACALLGYGPEVHLAPPQVSFTQRGLYRRKYPNADKEEVLTVLQTAVASYQTPHREIDGPIVWNKIGWSVYGKSFSDLAEEQRQAIRQQVNEIAADAGWQVQSGPRDAVLYRQPLSPDLDAAQWQVNSLLHDAAGAPLTANLVADAAKRAAYGRLYARQPLPAELAAQIAHLLTKHGYQSQPDPHGLYQPLPLPLSPDGLNRFVAQLGSLSPTHTEQGLCLWFDQVADLLCNLLPADAPPPSDSQLKRFLSMEAAPALRRLGYRPDVESVAPPQTKGQRREGLLRELKVKQDPRRSMQLVKGMRVSLPALAVDNDRDEIVYVEMVGPKGVVRSNWAALAAKKAHWLGSQRVYLNGMKNHIRLDARLPCGWHHLVLIHRQASLREANPEEPFYLLDDGRQPIPPLFYPLLNRCVALPLLPAWTDYLWLCGREAKLVRLLDQGQGQRYAAWRVLPSPDKWQKIVQRGLQSQTLRLAQPETAASAVVAASAALVSGGHDEQPA